MQKVLFSVLPKDVQGANETLEKVLFSEVEGIMRPSKVEMAYRRSADDAKIIVVNDSTTPAQLLQHKISEYRIVADYSSDHFPLLSLLDPEGEMVPEPAERMELALHLLDTMTIAHGIGLFHGQLNSERVFVHSDEPKCFLYDFYVGEVFNPYICPRDYRGPESIVRSDLSTAEKVDVWAMGCLLYELLTTDALFTLPSSKDDVGVTVPTLIRRQIMNIVETISDFPDIRGVDGETERKDVRDTTRGIDVFEKRYTELFDIAGEAKAEICDPRDSMRTQMRKKRFTDGTISEPFVWAIQQCLTFNPNVRPSLKEIRKGLLERLNTSHEIIASISEAIEKAKSNIAKVHSDLMAEIHEDAKDGSAEGKEDNDSPHLKDIFLLKMVQLSKRA